MSLAADTVVWFSVRRDQIELSGASQASPPTAAEPNAVCGTVQAIEYQGSYVKVTVHRSGHEDVIAHVPDRSFFPMHVQLNDRVVARWSIADVHILRAVGGQVDHGAGSGLPYDEAFDAPPR